MKKCWEEAAKHFWWSTDSKHIAFIHFDETEVPVYTIFNSEGKHGTSEKCHYPQAGDKNPAVKFGIVSVADPKIVWADFNEKDDQYFRSAYCGCQTVHLFGRNGSRATSMK